MRLPDYLRDRGLEVQDSGTDRHFRTGWLQIKTCPICGTSKYHLGWNIEKNYFNCWSCGWHSTWEIFKALFPHENIKEIFKQLDIQTPTQVVKDASVRGTLQLPAKVGELLPAHRMYIESRNLDPDELVTMWGIGGIGIDPIHPKFQWRLFVPATDQNGSVVSWTTRTIGHGIPYISASKEQEAMPIKSLLYGEQYRTFYDTIIVTEGVFDVFNIGVGAVATFGKTVTSAQILRISKYTRRVICFDNEPDTQEQAKSLCQELSLLPGETVNCCLDADDPGSASKKEVKQLRRLFLD